MAAENDRDERDGPRKELFERSQEALNGLLHGRADVIRRLPEPEIEDYKTGSLLDADTGAIKESYRTQMMLYAVLEHESSGVWPKRATLVPLEGSPITIDIDPAAATAAAEAAVAQLGTFNDHVEQGTPVDQLAAPSPDACRFCGYAIQCPAFWSSASTGWRDEAIIAVAGQISDREESRLSTFSAKVDSVAGSLGPGPCLLYQLDSEQFGALLGIPDGYEIAALWLIGSAEERQLRATARTRIATESDADR
jgi:hypothetical protein